MNRNKHAAPKVSFYFQDMFNQRELYFNALFQPYTCTYAAGMSMHAFNLLCSSTSLPSDDLVNVWWY